jgi:hypothetical protein
MPCSPHRNSIEEHTTLKPLTLDEKLPLNGLATNRRRQQELMPFVTYKFWGKACHAMLST